MAGSLAASLGAATTWTIVVLVLFGLGLGLGLAWRTWGGRSPIVERLRSLLVRGSDGDPDLDEEAAPAPDAMPRPAAAPEPRRATEPAAERRPDAMRPLPDRLEDTPAMATDARPDPAVASEWVEDAADWRPMDGPDGCAAGPFEGTAWADATAPWGEDEWTVWDDATDGPPVEAQESVPRPQVETADRRGTPRPEGHPNDVSYDDPDEPPVDPDRGTRVIPIVPPSRTGSAMEDGVSPWSFEDEAEVAGLQDAPPSADRSLDRSTDAEENPFAEDRDAAVEDEVDRLLGSGSRLVPVAPPKPASSTPEEPAGEAEPMKETAALATLPEEQLIPPRVSPLEPDRGRERPAEEPERRSLEPHDDPGAARKGPVVAVPKKRELSRTEAIEELTAIYAVSYEEACSLLDAGLWGFENHEEWIRAVRASGRPACVEDGTFEKVMSMPMKAIRDDLDKLREKRRATQELEQLWGVGADEASALYEAGFKTVDEIREASVDQLARLKEISHSTAFMIKAAAHGLAPDTT